MENAAPAVIKLTVADEDTGQRLDRFMAASLQDYSRNRLKQLIEAGAVRDGKGVLSDPASKTKIDQEIVLHVPETTAAMPKPEAIALDVIYEDSDLLVIDKPVGMVVHPAAGNAQGTLVNALLHHCGDSLSGIGGVARPGIVHRLDKDTGGLMVVAKNDIAHRGLSAQFENHSLDRIYKAIVWGVPSPRDGNIDANIGRSPHNRKKMAVVKNAGKTAQTHYQVDHVLGTRASLIECKLATGRTHQIRVHLSHLGHSLVGDPVYGRRPKGLSPEFRAALSAYNTQALYAGLIGFMHPVTHERHSYNREMPDYMLSLGAILEQF